MTMDVAVRPEGNPPIEGKVNQFEGAGQPPFSAFFPAGVTPPIEE
jgi:hypothetical protein